MTTKLDIFKTEDDIFEKAANRIDKTEKSLEEDAILLQEWLETQHHLPKLLDKHCLKNLLLLSKGNIEQTKQKIDKYYTIRSKLPEIFNEINPKFPYNEEMEEFSYLVVYPQTTKELYRIYFFKRKISPLAEKFEPINLARQIITLKEIRLREDVICGDVCVIDGKGVTLSMLLKYTPPLIYKTLILLYKEIFSMPLKACYIINFPSFAETLLNLVKSFMAPKLRERFHVFPDSDSLKKFIPSELLPKEFGGEGLSLEILEEAMRAKRLEYQDLFDSLDEARVDETLRPEKLKNDDFLGFYGNFKQLSID